MAKNVVKFDTKTDPIWPEIGLGYVVLMSALTGWAVTSWYNNNAVFID